jgi:hypothetical protein
MNYKSISDRKQKSFSIDLPLTIAAISKNTKADPFIFKQYGDSTIIVRSSFEQHVQTMIKDQGTLLTASFEDVMNQRFSADLLDKLNFTQHRVSHLAKLGIVKKLQTHSIPSLEREFNNILRAKHLRKFESIEYPIAIIKTKNNTFTYYEYLEGENLFDHLNSDTTVGEKNRAIDCLGCFVKQIIQNNIDFRDAGRLNNYYLEDTDQGFNFRLLDGEEIYTEKHLSYSAINNMIDSVTAGLISEGKVDNELAADFKRNLLDSIEDFVSF